MEIAHLKSAAQDHELDMTMMVEKFPDFYAALNGDANGTVQSPQLQFAGAIPTSSPSFMNPPSSFQFTDESSLAFFPHPLTTPRYAEFPAANYSQKKNSMAAMREMIFRIAAMQPIHIDPESVKPPKRRNVKISKDPQSVAARHRRERISERIRILQRLVPGGTKMDTASMLDEAIHYVKFLKTQVQTLERAQANGPPSSPSPSSSSSARVGFPVSMSSGSYDPPGKAHQLQAHLLN